MALILDSPWSWLFSSAKALIIHSLILIPSRQEMTLKQEMPGYFCYLVLLGRQQYVSYHKVDATSLLAAKREIIKAMGTLTNSETHYIPGYSPPADRGQ